jgi:peptidoglycan/LPS O-acetylase OafA/YrhL
VPELDGIRGIAALSVVCHHLFFTSINWRIWPWPEQWAGKGSYYGQYGVDLFFVLSGFLITSLLFQDRDAPNYYRNFYWKRALRILPLYFILLIALVIFDQSAIRYALLCAVFLANFAHILGVRTDGPYWTLAIEEQFYLWWPRIIRRRTVESVSRLAVGIILIESAVRLISAALGHVNFVFTFYRCDGLAFGALLACQYRLWRLELPPQGQRSWGVFRWIGLGGISLALLCAIAVQTKAAYYGSALLITAVGLLFYAVIGGAVKHSGSPLLHPFRSQPLVFFGEISYCLYMVHVYVLRLYDTRWGAITSGDVLQYLIRALAVLGISLALCVISRYLIERPALSLRKYILRKTVSRSRHEVCKNVRIHRFTLTALASSSLIAAALARGAWTRFAFENRMMRFFGKYSYGI